MRTFKTDSPDNDSEFCSVVLHCKDATSDVVTNVGIKFLTDMAAAILLEFSVAQFFFQIRKFRLGSKERHVFISEKEDCAVRHVY